MIVSRLSDLVQAAKDVLTSLEDEVKRLEAPSAPLGEVVPRQGPPPTEGGPISGAVDTVTPSVEVSTGEAAPEPSLADQLAAEPPASTNPDGSPVAAPEPVSVDLETTAATSL